MHISQKFASVPAFAQNHFSTERHLLNRDTCKNIRAAALIEWRGLLAGWRLAWVGGM